MQYIEGVNIFTLNKLELIALLMDYKIVEKPIQDSDSSYKLYNWYSKLNNKLKGKGYYLYSLDVNKDEYRLGLISDLYSIEVGEC